MDIENQDENQETNEEEEQETSEDNKLIKDLRKQLRAKDKELKDLRPLRETNAFLEAGLGTLSDDHKTALRAVVGEDFTRDNLLAKAKSLGFSVTEKSNDDREQEQIKGEVNTINETEESVRHSTAKPDTRDFVTKMREAKSQDELMQLIAQQGEEHGLLVSDDF